MPTTNFGICKVDTVLFPKLKKLIWQILTVESGLRPCLGVYHIPLMEAFNCSNADATTVFAVANELTFLTGYWFIDWFIDLLIDRSINLGPLASGFILVYGMKSCLFFGATLTSLGYALVYWTKNIDQVICCAALIG